MNQILDSEIKKLTLAERIQLVEDLWDDIARDSQTPWPLTDAQCAELERRVTLYEQAPNEGKDLSAIFAKHSLAV